jgi:CheY-like chemotaxis protein
VDDSQINLKLAKKKIELELGNSVEVLLAEDGFEAIETYKMLINSNKQSLLRGIFMDYHMPKCSGLDAIKAIRQIENIMANSPLNILKPSYIVAFTADLNEVSKAILIEAGANEVMAKPTPSRQLEDCCIKLSCRMG